MEFLIFDIIQAGIGRLYLLLRYRKKELINKVLEEEYEGSFSNVGKSLSISFFAILFGMLLFVFLMVMIVVALK
jgi:hypothetical protein